MVHIKTEISNKEWPNESEGINPTGFILERKELHYRDRDEP